MVFSKIFCGSFGIGLFVSSDTYKGKAAYIRISPDPAKAGSYWEVVVVVVVVVVFHKLINNTSIYLL